MITRAIAKEQIQDRVRQAERERNAAAFRRVRTRKVRSGMLAALASLRPVSGPSERPVTRVRTA
jgi:hypothetical protein